MSDEKKPFWETLPGILTGLAAVITALASLVTLFVRTGDKPAKTDESPRTHESAPDQRRDPPIKPVRESRPLNVSGIWRDVLFGTQVRMQQDGDEIKTATYNPATGLQLATGQAVLEGRAVTGTNRWFTGATYSVVLKISRDGKTMIGTFNSPSTGESGNVHLVR